MGEDLHNPAFGNDFFKIMPKAQATEENKMDSIIIKTCREVGVGRQWVRPELGMPAFHIRLLGSLVTLLLILLQHLGKQWKMPQVLESCQPCGRPRASRCLLASA